ncbi:unnamed protein product [Amoebophrya sp. A120]|nr:unnamed protein product [Amoebophrya sp. A120]|eukprot:GSA120T00002577001.1
MNNYHLYEEIGSGKFSVVYKGRKRHTIHYVAIKSVEKCRRAKVMTEVNMLSRLQTHPNVLEFYFWNETRNHLWVINEYCCGGDLMRLLKQDQKLDEEQSLRFAHDICEGLFFVHSRGIIYTDLKPSNVLFDETGRLKLSDFGMSILLQDLNKQQEDGTPVPRRGTPYYMAPELFLEDGIHSFSSDLWSLGIVFHEFVTGKPPFQPASFKELHNMILERPPPPLVGLTSKDYEDLVHSLLAKHPGQRADWNVVHEHPVWGTERLPSQGRVNSLPPQTHFERWKRRDKVASSGAGGSGAVIVSTSTSQSAFSEQGRGSASARTVNTSTSSANSTSASDSRQTAGNATSSAGTSNGDAGSTANAKRGGSAAGIPTVEAGAPKGKEGQTDAGAATDSSIHTSNASTQASKRLDPLRLSAIAQKNLIQENLIQEEPWNPQDLQLKGFDQELNFSEDQPPPPPPATSEGPRGGPLMATRLASDSRKPMASPTQVCRATAGVPPPSEIARSPPNEPRGRKLQRSATAHAEGSAYESSSSKDTKATTDAEASNREAARVERATPSQSSTATTAGRPGAKIQQGAASTAQGGGAASSAAHSPALAADGGAAGKEGSRGGAAGATSSGTGTTQGSSTGTTPTLFATTTASSSPTTPTPVTKPAVVATTLSPQQGAVGYANATPVVSSELLQKCRSLLSHVETSVRPISNNPAIEKITSPHLSQPELLPFRPLALEDVFVCSNQELESFLTKVYKCIAQGTIETKIMTLIYLENLCGHMQVADLVVNSSLLKLVLKMVRVRSTELRVRLWTLIGQLLRHATFLEPNIADLGIFEALTDAVVRHEDRTVQRKAAAALGELLFYVATQPKPEPGAAAWKVPQATLDGVTKAILQRDDEIVAHYSIKTLENISTQSPVVAQKWFLNTHGPVLADALHKYAKETKSEENFRLTCLGALAMVARISPGLAVKAMLIPSQSSSSSASSRSSSPSSGTTTGVSGQQQAGGSSSSTSAANNANRNSARYDFSTILLGLNGTLAPKGNPSSFHLLFAVLLQKDNLLLKAQRQDLEQITLHLLQLTAQTRGHTVFRGKSMLLLVLLAFVDVHFLLLAFENQFASHIEKTCARELVSKDNGKETGSGPTKDRYVSQCLQMTSVVLTNFTSTFLGNLANEMRRTGSGPQQSNGVTNTTSAHFARRLHLPVYLLSCPPLRACVMNAKALPHLTMLVTLANTPQWRATTAHRATLLVCENISAQVPMLLDCVQPTLQFLHAIASLLSADSNEESMFLALRCFGDITVALLNDDTRRKNEEYPEQLHTLLAGKFFPRLPVLLTCADPVPTVAMRLVSCILDADQIQAQPERFRSLSQALRPVKEGILGALSSQVAVSVHGANLASSLLRLNEISAPQLSDVFTRLLELISSRAEGSTARLDVAHLEAILGLIEICARDPPQELGSLLCPLLAIASQYMQSAPVLVERLIKVCETLTTIIGKGGQVTVFGKGGTVVRSLVTLVERTSRAVPISKWFLERVDAGALSAEVRKPLVRVLQQFDQSRPR